ncbi:conserved hypothetical protein [Paecilomyces variotii No. 5]|uniref:AB hydrolase-1 domain-containing protein n=1 Tax=Byssochlamys spectabilis (strain No. 5 / NBRC 109023) TaxID=1356009 RepID=V5G3M7_BYSSN|nr:conserved hypothetical protein [Paecilomyces variotii No. 5]
MGKSDIEASTGESSARGYPTWAAQKLNHLIDDLERAALATNQNESNPRQQEAHSGNRPRWLACSLHLFQTHAALRAAAYEVYIPTLLSVSNSRPPTADLNTDTEVVKNFVTKLADEGHNIVVILHSYSGQAGKIGGVAHLVYMCASASLEGVSMIDKIKGFGHMELMPLAFDFAEDGSRVVAASKVTMIGEGIPEEEAEAYIDTFLRWNGKCMYQPISRAAWREIPLSYIYTINDMTIPLVYQKSMVEAIEKEGCHVDTYELQTGHYPNLTPTNGVVDIIEKVTANVQT